MPIRANLSNFTMAPDLHQIKMVPQTVRKHRSIVKRITIITLLGIGIAIGIGIGFAASNTGDDVKESSEQDLSAIIQEEISAENIRENLKRLSSVPHIAGTPSDLEGAKTLRDTWIRQGLDTVKMKAYKVLLSYPSTEKGKENKVEIVNPLTKKAYFSSATREDPFGEKQLLQKGILPPYSAYSAAGDVQGDIIYVNYCSLADLQYLATFVYPAIDLAGKIFIARHGGINRSRKVLNAQQFGAIALILYMDPAEHCPANHDRKQNTRCPGPDHGKPYPDGPWLPDTAAQRGSVHPDVGDPLTPRYPATDKAFRVHINTTRLPTIPVHPISYSDAAFIIGNLQKRQELPREWTGKLNITYGIGPGFKGTYEKRKGRVVVHSEMQMRWTYNVIGFIKGETEPDRYVIVGNHRDAWGLGAVDPTSGTAALTEITRVFGKLKMNGWRPRRTLVFCSWGAEEFGLIGSVEWTEEYYHILTQRAVAYLNLDIAVAGDHVLQASASPHLTSVIKEATRKVADPNPVGSRQTVYDTMIERRSYGLSEKEIRIRTLRNAGSDYFGFLQGVGVPCVDVFYDSKPDKMLYSLYHTSYETFRLVEKYIDPGFKYHQGIARVVAEMVYSISNKQILPFDVTKYVEEVVMMFIRLIMHDPWRDEIAERGISIDGLESAVQNFTIQAHIFNNSLSEVNRTSPLAVRAVNDQMMLLERAFMLPSEHLPGQPSQRHVIMSPQLVSTHQAAHNSIPETFPGIVDTMVEAIARPSEEAWRNVEKHVSVLTYVIQSAADTIKDVTSWS